MGALSAETTGLSESECRVGKHVCIRVKNASSVTIDKLQLNVFTKFEIFENLTPNLVSEYRAVSTVYRSIMSEATIDGKVYDLLVIDFMGEQKLYSGLYTYEYTVHDFPEDVEPLRIGSSGYLQSNLVRD
jgi:hypothetical protein